MKPKQDSKKDGLKIRKPVPNRPGKPIISKKDKDRRKRVKYNTNQQKLEDKK